MFQKGFLFMLALFLLAGCGTASLDDTSGDSGDTPLNYRDSEATFITDILTEGESTRVLVKDIIFGFDEESEIVNDHGESLSVSDLEIGMRVVAESTGPILESYPGQTGAKKITVLTDQESEVEAEVIRLVVADIEEEGLNGFTIVREFKATDEGYEIAVDVSSGSEPNRVYTYKTETKELELKPDEVE
ncbi:hypothetical protein GCM10008967_41180 [Bacillus carboniphilus]|uniref:Lipoprotein n=1 Tax=Bacillus carboniphilus TaxID=86663 RepID=A0ABN0WUZ4_9BACI